MTADLNETEGLREEELRNGLARLARPVVPRPDPYRRLRDRARRRRRRQMLVSATAAFATLATAAPLLAGLDAPGAEIGTPAPVFQPAAPVDTPMARRLLDSPARGNLAGDRALLDALAREYLAARAELLVDPSLDVVRVLLAHETPAARSVVVAFLNDDGSRALIRSASAEPGSSVRDLLDVTGTPPEEQQLPPYVFYIQFPAVPEKSPVGKFVLGLAPAGCLVETSTDGRLTADGSVHRTWQVASRDGFVVRGLGEPAGRWRISCDGAVRYDGPAAGGHSPVRPWPEASAEFAGTRGEATDSMVADASTELTDMLAVSGLSSAAPQVRWSGRLPGAGPDAPLAVLVTACWPDAGCAALLRVGPGGTDDGSVRWTSIPAVGTRDLVVTGMPNDERGMLVVGPKSAVRAELLGAGDRVLADGPLADGVGRLAADHGEIKMIRVYDAAGTLLASLPAAPRLGSEWFGEGVDWDW